MKKKLNRIDLQKMKEENKKVVWKGGRVW